MSTYEKIHEISTGKGNYYILYISLDHLCMHRDDSIAKIGMVKSLITNNSNINLYYMESRSNTLTLICLILYTLKHTTGM